MHRIKWTFKLVQITFTLQQRCSHNMTQHIFYEFKKCLADHPEQLLYVFLDKQGKIKESYTYRSFDERTYAIAQLLQQKQSLVKGDRVLLAYPPGLEMICAFFACARIGLIPVPVYPPANQGFFSSLQKMNFIKHNNA